MENRIKILPDGNCLFRCFSLFLYNHENNHFVIRSRIIKYVLDNWEKFKYNIIGNSHYPNIRDENSYLRYMSQLGTYGTTSFC